MHAVAEASHFDVLYRVGEVHRIVDHFDAREEHRAVELVVSQTLLSHLLVVGGGLTLFGDAFQQHEIEHGIETH